MALYLGNLKISDGTPPAEYKTYDNTLQSLSDDGYALTSWVQSQVTTSLSSELWTFVVDTGSGTETITKHIVLSC